MKHISTLTGTIVLVVVAAAAAAIIVHNVNAFGNECSQALLDNAANQEVLTKAIRNQ